MALGASHKGEEFVANKVFTDREDARELFKKALCDPQGPNDYRILHWYGVGGQGKTALSHELMRIYEETRQTASNKAGKRRFDGARISFQRPVMRQPDRALLSLRVALSKAAGVRFPSFDIGFARYFALTKPSGDIRTEHPTLFTAESELLNDLLEITEGGLGEIATDAVSALIPGLNILVKYTARFSKRTQAWWNKRGSKQLVGLDQLDADDLLEKLPVYFGMDLCAAMKADSCLRPVIVLDGYEQLWTDVSGSSTNILGQRADRWVRQLVEDTPGTLYCVLGRDKLTWPDIDAEWAGVIDDHLLGGLSDEDANLFLEKVPVAEPEIRERIIQGAGKLPLYLDLQVDIYAARKSRGLEITMSDFGGSHTEILARFVDHLSPEEEQLLRLASYPAALDEDTMVLLAEKFLGGSGHLNWARLTARSFISEDEDGDLVMHQLMREAFQQQEEKERAVLFKQVHLMLFELYDNQIPDQAGEITPSHDAVLNRAAVHMASLEQDQASIWLNEKIALFEAAGRHKMCFEHWSAVVDVFRKNLGQEAESTLIARYNMARQMAALGDNRGALEEFKAIHAIQSTPDRLGPDHQNTLVTRHEIANQMAALGDNRGALEEFKAIHAIQSTPDRLGPDHQSTLVTRHEIAKQMAALGDNRSALEEFKAIHAILSRPDRLGPDHQSTLTTRHEIARQMAALGDNRGALEEFKAIHAIQSTPDRLGPDHQNTLVTRHEIANQMAALGDNRGALEEFKAIHAIQSTPDRLGPDHQSTLTTRHEIARQMAALGDNRGALEEFKAIHAIWSRPDRLGPEHSHSLITKGFMARVTARLGNADQALEELVQVIAALSAEDNWGAEHPRLLQFKLFEAEALMHAGALDAAATHARDLREQLPKHYLDTHEYFRELTALEQAIAAKRATASD